MNGPGRPVKMRKVLIIFAHPRLENSRINRRLLEAIPRLDNITFHDLYESYPDFNIDVEREKALLLEHDVIVWHHPFYWYSSPPLLKQWIDMVLEYGWAYGRNGDKLQGKIIFNAITAGGNTDAYCPEGYNCYTIADFLRPFQQTARLCLMEYLPPFAVLGTHRLTGDKIGHAAEEYGRLLSQLGNGGFDLERAKSVDFLNEIL
jgi:glutathione-regulated potassium-efflux system ancillary protein KefG